MESYSVYMHIFPNNKYYIGLTKQFPNDRWGVNGIGYKNQPVYSAIKYFGWNNIEHKILYSGLSGKEAHDKEIELIEKYDSIENGYNISIGGGMGGNPWCEFEYNEFIYTAEELAEMSDYDLTYHDITNRINSHGWTIERAISTPKGKRNIKFLYNDKKYTVKQLYSIRINKDLSYEQIKNRLLQFNWDVERAITQSNNVKIQPHGVGTCEFEYNGKKYNSWELCELSSIEGLQPQHITDRVNRRGWSVERAITTPLKQMNKLYEYNGRKYTSKELVKLSPIKNITHHTLTDRINRQGWSIEKAITTPINKKQK